MNRPVRTDGLTTSTDPYPALLASGEDGIPDPCVQWATHSTNSFARTSPDRISSVVPWSL